jgi:hypothetical protein
MLTWHRDHTAGKDPKHHKVWRARHYRIVWRDQVEGATVDAGYQVCMQVPGPSGRDYWEFVEGRRLRPNLKQSKNLCNRHYTRVAK